MKKTNNITEIVFILDASGSMSPLRADTIGGFNTMLSEQKQNADKAYVSTVMFSDSSKVVHDRRDISEIPELTAADYAPMGCTALYDAVGSAIKHISDIHKYARSEDVPQKTLFIITTDGMENASRTYKAADVKKMISKKEKKGWEFIFIGANIDAAVAASDIGISEERAVNYHADAKGTSVLFSAVNKAVGSARRCAEAPMDSAWRRELDEDMENR